MHHRMQEQYGEVARRLTGAGMRPTRQRIMLASLLWSKGCRHLTAEMLHAEAKEHNIKVSLATVYNTLHQFTDVGLLRQIVVDGHRTFFDTNVEEHHHFLNEDNGELHDIPASEVDVRKMPSPPPGMKVASVDVLIRVKSL